MSTTYILKCQATIPSQKSLHNIMQQQKIQCILSVKAQSIDGWTSHIRRRIQIGVEKRGTFLANTRNQSIWAYEQRNLVTLFTPPSWGESFPIFCLEVVCQTLILWRWRDMSGGFIKCFAGQEQRYLENLLKTCDTFLVNTDIVVYVSILTAIFCETIVRSTILELCN